VYLAYTHTRGKAAAALSVVCLLGPTAWPVAETGGQTSLYCDHVLVMLDVCIYPSKCSAFCLQCFSTDFISFRDLQANNVRKTELNFLPAMQSVTVNYDTLFSATTDSTALLYGSPTLYAAYSNIFS